MLLCQELLDHIEELSLRVLLAPTGAITAPVMAPAMEEVDIAVVDTGVPAIITNPATNPEGDTAATDLVMAPAIMDPAMAVTTIMAPAMAVTTIMDPAMAVIAIMAPVMAVLITDPFTEENKSDRSSHGTTYCDYQLDQTLFN